MYLTPARYRTFGSGVSLDSKTDAEISSKIAAASAYVNSYCCVPVGHDFRGGTVIDEQHEWDPGTTRTHGTYRVWPYHRPIISVESLSIDVTKNQYITFGSPDSLYIQFTEGWVEPVDLSLTAFGVFGYGVLPNIGLHRPVAKISYTYGWDFAAVDEPVAVTSDALQAQNQFWTDAEVVLKKNGIIETTGFDINRREGRITLDALPDPDDEFAVSYHYPLPFEIAQATSMIVTELFGSSSIAASGLTGLSGIKVEEVELRQSRASFMATGISPAAAILLDPYVVRSMA